MEVKFSPLISSIHYPCAHDYCEQINISTLLSLLFKTVFCNIAFKMKKKNQISTSKQRFGPAVLEITARILRKSVKIPNFEYKYCCKLHNTVGSLYRR